jgi:diacylglycerol kinase family enzyme
MPALLGVVAVRVDNARQEIELSRRGHGQGLTMLTAGEVTADAAQIPVGIDGETVMLSTPVRCTIRPRALRVVVPKRTARRSRPQVASASPTRVLPCTARRRT